LTLPPHRVWRKRGDCREGVEIAMKEFSVRTEQQEELVDITSKVQGVVGQSKIEDGMCVVFIPHTTAGVTINENADPTVKGDIIKGLKVIPSSGYLHSEGNSPAHIKASIIGSSVTIFIEKGKLALGVWQGVYFTEFDGPRQRSIWVKVGKL